MKVVYDISSVFCQGLPGEDFFSKDPDYPGITITVNANLADDDIKIKGPDEDDWYDAEVNKLTMETALRVLQKITGADEIVINENNVRTKD